MEKSCLASLRWNSLGGFRTEGAVGMPDVQSGMQVISSTAPLTLSSAWKDQQLLSAHSCWFGDLSKHVSMFWETQATRRANGWCWVRSHAWLFPSSGHGSRIPLPPILCSSETWSGFRGLILLPLQWLSLLLMHGNWIIMNWEKKISG